VDLERKVNKYFVTIPVGSWEKAQLLGSETNWKVLETLRDAGLGGLTTEEISKKVDVPRSTIYGILKELQAADWVESGERRRQWGRPSKEVKQRFGGKPARVYIVEMLWGNQFDEEFTNSYQLLLDRLEDETDELKKKFLSLLDKIVSAFETSEDLKEFFPKDGKMHEKCGWSHEAQEFLYATSFALLERILSDKDFDELARRHKFLK